MTPATAADRLVVALDVRPSDSGPLDALAASVLAGILVRGTSVRLFKVLPEMLMQRYGLDLVEAVVESGATLFFDAKRFDVRDTVGFAVPMAFDLGASIVTVHPSCAAAAMATKPKHREATVLAVPGLSDADPADWSTTAWREALTAADGIVCHPGHAAYFRRWCPDASRGKLFASAGIRPSGDVAPGCHASPVTPAEAIRSGIDLLVVGRPIWRAPDPAAAANAILAEMDAAIAGGTAA